MRKEGRLLEREPVWGRLEGAGVHGSGARDPEVVFPHARHEEEAVQRGQRIVLRHLVRCLHTGGGGVWSRMMRRIASTLGLDSDSRISRSIRRWRATWNSCSDVCPWMADNSPDAGLHRRREVQAMPSRLRCSPTRRSPNLLTAVSLRYSPRRGPCSSYRLARYIRGARPPRLRHASRTRRPNL